ncbi:MAG: mRNA surveillance protein pelota [Candidatus Ranarchaeia archaeon]
MKVIHRDLAHGQMKLSLDSLEDLWHLYNIVYPGDNVFSVSFRRIRQEETNRPDKGERKKIFLGVNVEEVNFHEFSDSLRMKGKIVESSDDNCPMGSYHTFNFQVGDTIKIVKEKWPRYVIQRINRAVKETLHPRLIIISLEEGIAQIARVSNAGIALGPAIDSHLPGKRYTSKNRSAGIQKFFDEIIQTIDPIIETHKPQKIILAGPGMTYERVFDYIKKKRPKWTQYLIKGHISASGTQGIYESLRSEALKSELENLDIQHETELMNEFLRRLGKGQKNIAYGLKEIKRVVNQGAVENLLIIEDLLRVNEVEKREELDKLLLMVEKNRGKITIVNTNHPSGKQIESFGGIVVLLRYEIH